MCIRDRFSLANGTSPGSDMRFYDKKVEAAGNFANKIWNASRFVAMNLDCLLYTSHAAPRLG